MSQRPRLSDILYGDMLGRIQRGQFPGDGKLPSEKELSQNFGVSRPIVRDALRRLREDGLIQSRQGAGSFVTAAPASPPARPANGAQEIQTISDVRRVYEFRIALEGEVAYAAALNRSEALAAAIKKELDAIDQAIQTGKIGVQQDSDFHAAVARATQNQYFQAALAAVRPHLDYVIDLARSFSMLHSGEHLAMVQREHAAVYEAIRDGDAVKAREAMQAHIRNAQERVFDGIHL
ncbi:MULTISPECIES: FadR/GntR family transcriptional regulator [unclassified Inquilinus]|uniref:FadR/GntR family transcriptional regulator n=1 Tax=unclassified Inquilinus TaxID=2645927 RepID=UPI003F9167D4